MSSRKTAHRGRRARKRVENVIGSPGAGIIFGDPGTGGHALGPLCKQVEEALAYALAGSRDPLLRDLAVVSVKPQRGAALLEVAIDPRDRPESAGELMDKLARSKGYLRSEAAAAITRKRVPDLVFVILPPGREGTHG